MLNTRNEFVQGNETNLETFQETFSVLKAKGGHQEDQCPLWQWRWWEPNREPHHPIHLCPSHTCQLHQPVKRVYGPAGTGLYWIQRADRQDTTVQQLYEELQQLKEDNQALASYLRGSIEARKQENSVIRAQLSKVKEDAENRERSFARKVQHLTDQLSAVPTVTTTETQTLPASVPNHCLVAGPPSLTGLVLPVNLQ